MASRLVSAVAVREDPVADAHVEIPVAVDVPHAVALAALQHHRVRELIPHASGVAGRDQRARPVEQLQRSRGSLAVAALGLAVEFDAAGRDVLGDGGLGLSDDWLRSLVRLDGRARAGAPVRCAA
jgi:hypothetical protein